MQSAMPHHPHHHRNSKQNPRLLPTARATFGAPGTALRGAPKPYALASRTERRLRLRAGLAYAIPFVPALVLLVSERRHRWVRLHAAQSLFFFVALVIAQIALFAALVLVGGVVVALPAAAVAGLVFYGLYLLAGIIGLVFWLRLVADAMAGRSTRFRFLSGAAMRLEERLARMQRLVPAQRPPVRIDGHAHHNT